MEQTVVIAGAGGIGKAVGLLLANYPALRATIYIGDQSYQHAVDAAQWIEDGRNHLVLRDPLPLPFAVRLLQGSADEDVSRQAALALFDHAESSNMTLTFVKDADHRFSTPECLAMITTAIDAVT